ncbi:membrane metallo-endopeptidase-like 1 isoform X3 [Paramacrobiotus metropolitanus]|uniref:membrane metallo-endopeptidase-like 1 isoform X3 n=1 Tax=Paramacrobiotus metropolitanus TaxID=2943436 RepID=UPI0024465A27|nr:membrane metallo-endopeptidase-like 1 isoform X3 [Paramacrobiotus metropolitanus]
MLLLNVIRFLFTAVSVIQANERRQLSTTLCTSDLCKQTAREIVSSMDENVDPCVDFYAYACNRWNRSSGMANEALVPKIFRQLQELFDSGNYTNPTEQKAIDIYNQCINRTHEKPFDDGSLVRAIDDVLDGWSLLNDHRNVSSFRLEHTLVRLQQNDIRTFSDLTVLRNEFSINENILYFATPSRLFGRWNLEALVNAHNKPTVRNATAQLMNKWTPVVRRLLIAASASVQWSTIEKRLEKALTLDAMLAAVRAVFRKPTNFLPLFNAMLKASSVHFHATTATQFGAPLQLEYLLNLDQTMAQLECDGEAGLATLADWLWWTAFYHFHLVYRGTGTCVGLVKATMPLAVSGMFLKKYIPREAVQKAKVLTSEIANSVRDAVLLKTTWMDRATQEAAMDRLKHTLQNVGYPEEFLENWRLIDDLYAKVQVGKSLYDTLRTIDQSNSWINLQKLSRTNARNDPFFPTDLTSINAKVYPDSNYIVIPAALLQPPMFYANDLEVLNYARLGAVIGHEFTHVF